MDLCSQTTHDVILPTAAFAVYPPDDDTPADLAAPVWQHSLLNPKNRINSLDALPNAAWRVDAVAENGTDFFIVPQFLDSFPFLRVGLTLPEYTSFPKDLREELDMSAAFHMRDPERVNQLGITRHILRILQHWTISAPNIEKVYNTLSWGAMFHLETLPRDVKQARITVKLNHEAEEQLWPVEMMEMSWGHEVAFPEMVDLHNLVYRAQPHDSVCVVSIHGKQFVFKAVTSQTKYLYNELRHLLLMKPHEHIVARPRHIVTKRSLFDGEAVVVGFTLDYHQRSCARDHLPLYRIRNLSTMAKETRWCMQIASALDHFRRTRKTYCSDIRLDNVLLSDTDELVMVDFEQRGVWFEFAPPEVNAIDIMCSLRASKTLDPAITSKYHDVLSSLIPDLDMLLGGQYFYTNHGFNLPWLALTPKEREACEVFMLGRIMWCIFEAACAPHRGVYWVSYRRELDIDFPQYRSTPSTMRDLIDRCTRGHRTCFSELVFRQGGKVILREHEGTNKSTAAQVRKAARAFWKEEVRLSEQWIEERKVGMATGTWNENYYGRPTLQEVRDELQAFFDSLD